MRKFELARKVTNRFLEKEAAYPDAIIPEYQTKYSAGADFFAAEDIVIPSIWEEVDKSLHRHEIFSPTILKPTLVHTGIKACMEEDEVLYLYNRSSNPGKLGLILANGVGVVDSDYYNNKDNDGEIMFAFYNIGSEDVTISAGDRIGQGVFQKYLRPTVGLKVKQTERIGGLGSTDKPICESLSKAFKEAAQNEDPSFF